MPDSLRPGSSASEVTVHTSKSSPRHWWLDEDGLFSLDDEGRAERQQCAVSASNIIRNFSFMPENESIMAQHRHTLETVFQCIEDHVTGQKFVTLMSIAFRVSCRYLMSLVLNVAFEI